MLQILRNGAEKLTLAGAYSLSIHREGEVPHGERSAQWEERLGGRSQEACLMGWAWFSWPACS